MNYSITNYIGFSNKIIVETFTATSDNEAIRVAKATGRKSQIGLVVNVYRGGGRVGRPVTKKSVRIATI